MQGSDCAQVITLQCTSKKEFVRPVVLSDAAEKLSMLDWTIAWSTGACSKLLYCLSKRKARDAAFASAIGSTACIATPDVSDLGSHPCLYAVHKESSRKPHFKKAYKRTKCTHALQKYNGRISPRRQLVLIFAAFETSCALQVYLALAALYSFLCKSHWPARHPHAR